jgi:hypothetical protein
MEHVMRMRLPVSARRLLVLHTPVAGNRSENCPGVTLRACMSATGLLIAALAVTTNSGCVTAGKMGVKLVGTAVHTVDVDTQSKKLIGQPVSAADAEFGQRVNTFEDTRSKREIMTYKVEGDALDLFRWVVEAQGNRIVALMKTQFNADLGKDLVKTALYKDKVLGKTPQEIQTHSTFKNLVLTVRNRSTGNLVRVYDVRGVTDLMGAQYCVLEFDKSDRGAGVRLVGVPASAGISAISG